MEKGMKRVLLIGVDPRLIDLSNVKDLDAEKIRSAGQDSERILRELGFEPEAVSLISARQRRVW
jgi:hypothetical protein